MRCGASNRESRGISEEYHGNSRSRTAPTRKIDPATTIGSVPARAVLGRRHRILDGHGGQAGAGGDGRQIRRCRRARRGGRRAHELAHVRRDCAQHLGDRLVLHRAEHERHARRRLRRQVGRQRPRAGRVVRRVEQDAAVPPLDRLEPSRPHRRRQARATRARRGRGRAAASASIEFEQPQRDAGVRALVRAGQRERQSPRPARASAASVPVRTSGAPPRRADRGDDVHRLGGQRAAHHRHAGLRDAGLLRTRSTRAWLPSCAWWSKSIDTMAVAIGDTTLVASSRPPRPTSSTRDARRPRRGTDRTRPRSCIRRRSGSASSAPDGNEPPRRVLHPFGRSVERVGRDLAIRRRRSALRGATRCGEVYRAARWPAARARCRPSR